MTSLRQLSARFLAFFQQSRLDQEFEAELAGHLEFATDDNLKQGMSPAVARRRAVLRFGNVQQVRELQRTTRGLPWLDTLVQDLRFTFRTLARDRIFALVAVLILALGIGASITVFSVVNTLLLRPLPFPDSRFLVRIVPKVSRCGDSCATYSTDAVQEYQQRTRVLAEVTGYDAFTSVGNWKLTDRPVPLPVTGVDVMDNFFRTLGVTPFLGRCAFSAEESRPTAAPVVILSYSFWKRQFHADRAIIGKSISLDGSPATVIGVLPETFDFGAVYAPGSRIDLFTPYIYDRVREYGNMISLTGRLRPGATLAQAQAEADLLFPDLDGSVKHAYKGRYTARIWELKDFVAGSLRRSLILLWASVGFIQLIVCLNLSNLLLARSAARSREFAMRSALGAARGRLIRQHFTESLVLAGAGATVGLALAFVAVLYLAHQGSLALPLLASIRLDRTAIVWTLLIAIFSALLFGIAPGLRSASGNLQGVLKSSSSNAAGSLSAARFRTALVVSEIALSCVLLVGAGLLLRSFLHVMDVDLGFRPAQAASMRLDVREDLKTPQQLASSLEVLTHRVEQVPGIEAVAIADSLPMSRNRSWYIAAAGKHYEPGELPGTFVTVVTPGYFKVLGIRLLRGRDLAWTDTDPKEAAVIINQTVARSLWPHEDAVGRLAMIDDQPARIVGVVDDVRETSAEAPGGWQMYISVSAPQFGASNLDVVVRSRVSASVLQPSILAILRDTNPGQPATDLKPLQLLVDHASSPRRFFAYLVSIFAALGLILASLGIYGVVSYTVTQRTPELGLRLALGATRANVQNSVLAQTLRLALIGIAAGTVASLAASSLISSLLFSTQPNDPTTFASILLVLVTVTLAAGYLPARRASRVDPLIALRSN